MLLCSPAVKYEFHCRKLSISQNGTILHYKTLGVFSQPSVISVGGVTVSKWADSVLSKPGGKRDALFIQPAL